MTDRNDRIYYSQSAAMRAQRDRTMLAIVVLGLGLGIGAAMALLFAPRSGDETRRELGREANRVTDNLQREFERLRRDVEERLQNA
jgi:gas vesicle protein